VPAGAQHQQGEGGLVLESTLPSFPVIFPFRSHEWDRLVSGVAHATARGIGPVLVKGPVLVTGQCLDPSGNQFDVITLGPGSGDRADLHGRSLCVITSASSPARTLARLSCSSQAATA
jgi:hypothetical protein